MEVVIPERIGFLRNALQMRIAVFWYKVHLLEFYE